MLPPPVFSTRFERILPPDIPPSTAPPPPPPSSSSLQKTTGNGQTEVFNFCYIYKKDIKMLGEYIFYIFGRMMGKM